MSVLATVEAVETAGGSRGLGRVHQIGVVVEDLRAAARWYRAAYGVETWYQLESTAVILAARICVEETRAARPFDDGALAPGDRRLVLIVLGQEAVGRQGRCVEGDIA